MLPCMPNDSAGSCPNLTFLPLSSRETYILTKMGNDNALGEIIEAYDSLNDMGKKVAHERITELLEIPKYRKDTE